jgi:hypothetical protein
MENQNSNQGSMAIMAIIGAVVIGLMAVVCGFAAMNRPNNMENVSPACPGYYNGLNYMSDPAGGATTGKTSAVDSQPANK